MRKLKAVLLASLVALTAITGVAAAATFHDEYHPVDGNTEHVFVEVEDTNGTNVTATFYGVDSNGNETQEKQVTLNAGSGETDSYELTNVDSTNYSEYRVVVEGTGDHPAAINSGTSDGTSSGAGFSLDDQWLGVPAWIVLFLLISAAGVFYNGGSRDGRR